MILVSENGRVREFSSGPLDAKIRAARDDFRRDIEAQLEWRWRGIPREILVPEGPFHREPRPKRRVSLGISEQLA